MSLRRDCRCRRRRRARLRRDRPCRCRCQRPRTRLATLLVTTEGQEGGVIVCGRRGGEEVSESVSIPRRSSSSVLVDLLSTVEGVVPTPEDIVGEGGVGDGWPLAKGGMCFSGGGCGGCRYLSLRKKKNSSRRRTCSLRKNTTARSEAEESRREKKEIKKGAKIFFYSPQINPGEQKLFATSSHCPWPTLGGYCF